MGGRAVDICVVKVIKNIFHSQLEIFEVSKFCEQFTNLHTKTADIWRGDLFTLE